MIELTFGFSDYILETFPNNENDINTELVSIRKRSSPNSSSLIFYAPDTILKYQIPSISYFLLNVSILPNRIIYSTEIAPFTNR